MIIWLIGLTTEIRTEPDTCIEYVGKFSHNNHIMRNRVFLMGMTKRRNQLDFAKSTF